MSCKNFSTSSMLLSLSLSLCLALFFTGVSCSAQNYVHYDNVVFRSRSLFLDPLAPRSNAPPQAVERRIAQTAQQARNGQRVAPAAPAAGQAPPSSAVPVPVQAPATAPARAQGPQVTVHGVERAPSKAAGQASGSSQVSRPPAQFNYRERFSSLLFQPIARSNANRNVVYSPSSVHGMLAMLYGVSNGLTSTELQLAGQFQEDKLALAFDFQRVNQQEREVNNALLIVANKLYYNREHSTLNPDYARYAREFYGSDIEAVDMKRPGNTAARINAWASDATRNTIRDLVSPSDIDQQTEALLVNAIYFKARWQNEFSAMDTSPEKFRVNSNKAVQVLMMFNDDVFPYAELPELDAKAIELAYLGTQASMLLILPNQVDGLPQLERQLERQDLNSIAARLNRESVAVRIPKFRIEFEQDLAGPLQQLGVRRIFTSDSEVDAMLMRPVKISKILQKAFIDVNEAGSEAAAASFAKFVPLSLPMKPLEFTADHPFIFAIRTPESVLFVGHVVQPPQVNIRQ